MNRTLSSDENNTQAHSHRMVIIRCMINMGLYWPLWWFHEWILKNVLIDSGLAIEINNTIWANPSIFQSQQINTLHYGLWSSLGKMLFYSNLFFMLIGWYLIAKGKPEIDKAVIKFSLFIIFILVIMEIPVWLYVFSTGQG